LWGPECSKETKEGKENPFPKREDSAANWVRLQHRETRESRGFCGLDNEISQHIGGIAYGATLCAQTAIPTPLII
jgi:hypothetical protein